MSEGGELVITGYSVVSPIGIGKKPFWDSLSSGRSGVATLDFLRDTPMPVRFGAEVKDFDGKKYVKPRKSLKVMCREIQLGFAAAALAIEDGRVEEIGDPERYGIVYGSEMFYCEPTDLADATRQCTVDGEYSPEMWGEHALPQLYPLWMLMYLPNMIACHLAIAQNALGPNNTISSGDCSGLLALIEAADVIVRGHADIMIAGGVGRRIGLPVLLYRGDANLSHRNDDPAAACRPFERDRDGVVNGEGAAALILESRKHAAARGANVLARVRGWGRSYESRLDGVPPSGDGLRRAIAAALEMAGVSAADLGHVNAHGVSTLEDDQVEAEALRELVGETPVTALKSYFGHLGAAGGTVELAGSLAAMEHQLTPPTLNYRTPDPKCPLNVVTQLTPLTSPLTLVVNQSATGQAAAVVLEATG